MDADIQAYEQTLEKSPNDRTALLGLARSYELKHEYGMAEAYYAQLLELNPKDKEAILALANLYKKDARYAESLEMYNMALDLDPGNKEIQAQINLLKNWSVNIDQRILDINKRVLWNRKDVTSYLTLGNTFLWKQDVDQAKKTFKEGLEANPDDASLWYSLGQVSEMEGDWYKARECYNEALERDPNYIEAEIALEDLKYTYRPRLTTTYNFNRSARYDDWLGFTRTIERDDVGTIKYTQPIRPWLELSMGYSYTLSREIDRIFDFRQYMIDKQAPHFEANFILPYDIDILASYDLNIYSNRLTSRFTLDNTEFRHSAFFSIQKYIWYNTLGFQYTRDFYTDTTTGQLLIEAMNRYAISDNITFNDYVWLVVAMAIVDRSNAETYMEYLFRPKFRIPYENRVFYAEYEFKFADHPNRYEHMINVGLQNEITRWLTFDISYQFIYYTLVSQASNAGVFSFIITPTKRLQFTIDGQINYFDKDIGQYYVASMRIIL